MAWESGAHACSFQSRYLSALAALSRHLTVKCSMQAVFALWQTNVDLARQADDWTASVLKMGISASIAAIKFIDIMTDAGMSARWLRQYRAGDCAWNGGQQCQIYLRLCIASATVSGVAYVTAMATSSMFAVGGKSSTPSRATLISLHTVMLLCEAVSLSTAGLQLQATQQNSQNSRQRLAANGSMPYIVLSGSLTLGFFVATVLALWRSWTLPAPFVAVQTQAGAIALQTSVPQVLGPPGEAPIREQRSLGLCHDVVRSI